MKTFNITYRENSENPLSNKTVTYSAKDMNEAKKLFYKDYPEQINEEYLEIHWQASQTESEAHNLANYDPKEHWDNYEVPPETKNNNNNTTTTTSMKKFNILNIFKMLNDYIRQLTLLIVSLIPLLLLGVVLFGDNFFLGNVVVYNIQNILDSMAGFVGLVTLLIIVHVYYKFSLSSK